jgi:hypothetical protein
MKCLQKKTFEIVVTVAMEVVPAGQEMYLTFKKCFLPSLTLEYFHFTWPYDQHI